MSLVKLDLETQDFMNDVEAKLREQIQRYAGKDAELDLLWLKLSDLMDNTFETYA